MQYKIVFIVVTALALVTVPAILAAVSVAVAHLAGMRRAATVSLAFGVVGAAAAGIIALASLIAGLAFPH
ncbi:hypothetical protein [Dactylosporangium sp. CS-033363]|uniref:hypothetical protein n=1 Tax=Dactylosporangium sp. CS-033363 TaxID=3239935 RepID=UPI003D8CF21C